LNADPFIENGDLSPCADPEMLRMALFDNSRYILIYKKNNVQTYNEYDMGCIHIIGRKPFPWK
jgi:hypothetical protein